ncbi:MAG: hypothetical protein NY202_04370 [Mollicutes bacterium UO1]
MVKTCKLGEICEIRSGKTPNPEEKIEGKWDCISYYKITDINEGVIKPQFYITNACSLEKLKINLITEYSLLYWC